MKALVVTALVALPVAVAHADQPPEDKPASSDPLAEEAAPPPPPPPELVPPRLDAFEGSPPPVDAASTTVPSPTGGPVTITLDSRQEYDSRGGPRKGYLLAEGDGFVVEGTSLVSVMLTVALPLPSVHGRVRASIGGLDGDRRADKNLRAELGWERDLLCIGYVRHCLIGGIDLSYSFADDLDGLAPMPFAALDLRILGGLAFRVAGGPAVLLDPGDGVRVGWSLALGFGFVRDL